MRRKRTKKWFKPKRHSGFRKEYSIQKNLRVMYRRTPKNWTPKRRWLRVGRQAQALANVTQDRETERKARRVAEEAFRKARRYKK